MHERDRKRAASVAAARRPMTPKAPEPDFREGKGYRFMVSKKLSVILGSICFLVGLFSVVDFWGPKTTSHEKIFCFPTSGNYFLIRTDKSFFPTDPRLQYETPRMHDALIDVQHSMSGVPLSFTLPELAPGELFYPVSTRYSYIGLQILCLAGGIVLLVYRKRNDMKMYIVFFGFIAFLCGILPMVGMEVTIRSVNNERSMNCDIAVDQAVPH